MRAHMPPFSPNQHPGARLLYDETSAIAAAQDAKSALTDAERYAKLRTAAHYFYHGKLLMDEALDGWCIQSDTGISAESPHSARADAKAGLVELAAEAQRLGLYDETPAIAAAQDAKLNPVMCSGRTRVMPLVLADLDKRIAKGSKEYGEPLTTNNGRDALWDAYEEALDLSLYLRQAIEERKQSAAAQAETSRRRDVLSAEELRGFGIGDVEPATLRPLEWDEVGGTFARTVARHPANAEALRMADERTPEDRL